MLFILMLLLISLHQMPNKVNVSNLGQLVREVQKYQGGDEAGADEVDNHSIQKVSWVTDTYHLSTSNRLREMYYLLLKGRREKGEQRLVQ